MGVRIFSWEPALETLNSREGEAEVKKKHCNFRQLTVTFEHRHENKSCSACPEDQLKPLKFLKISNFKIFQNFKFFKFL